MNIIFEVKAGLIKKMYITIVVRFSFWLLRLVGVEVKGRLGEPERFLTGTASTKEELK
jgi:hypothetical protein